MDHGLAQFRMIGSELWVSRTVLNDLGLRVDEPAAGGGEMISVAAAFGDAVTYNAAAQALTIMVEPRSLAVATSRLNFDTQDNPVPSSATGGLLNYDLFANYVSGNVTFDGVTEARVFSGNFLLENTSVFNLGRRPGGSDARVLRLDTSAALTFPESRITVRAGDIVTRATSLSRPSRIGGPRIGTDFALQPYLVTAPVAAFYGEATLPSTVDLYIDGIRRYSSEIAPGPFEVGSGPTRVNGAANAELVVTDILGQVMTLDFPLYDTPLLLREGLVDWSVEVGAIRENYGQRSFDYGKQLVASASLRRGMSDTLTMESHVEVTADLFTASGGVAFARPGWGVVTASAAASQSEGATGHRFEVGYSFTQSSFNLAATLQRTSRDFADIPSREGARFPLQREIISAGYNTNRWGTFGASIVRQSREGEPRSSFATASWSRIISDDLSISVSGNLSLEDSSDRGVFATLTFVPDNRDQYRASLQANERRTVGSLGYRRSVPYEGGLGWALDGSVDGRNFRGTAQLDHLGSYGQATAGMRTFGSSASGYLGYSGALVVVDKGVHVSRKIFDGFALVSTGGMPDVPVKLNNREVGHTSESGHLLVTGLNAYQRNRISIDTVDLPVDIEVREDEQQAVPSLRAGTIVEFALSPSHAVLLTVVDEEGAHIPVGTLARVANTNSEPMMVGFDGRLFIEDAAPEMRVIVDLDETPCTLDLPAVLPQNTAGRLGEITCSRRR